MIFDYCISNPAFNVAEGNNIAGTGGNTTLYKTATRHDYNRRLKNGGHLVNVTLKGIITDLNDGYFKGCQVDRVDLMDNINVWPYNTCYFIINKVPRTSIPVITGGLAAKMFSPNRTDCFPFVYYSGSNNGMNKFFDPTKPNKVIRQLPGKGRNQVAYDYTDKEIATGPKFAFYVMESGKSYTVTTEPVCGGTICYVPTTTISEAEKLKLFVENNEVFAKYVQRMKLRGHAFGLRYLRKFDLNQIVTGKEIPKEWNITATDLDDPRELANDITKDRDRVKALGEVFTPTLLVEEVLDAVELNDPTAFTDPDKTYIDSMCGDGQFLVAILNRKIARGINPHQALSTIYGIDLTQANVDACRARLLKDYPAYTQEVIANVVCADSLGDKFTL
jgi:hypothetical protein